MSLASIHFHFGRSKVANGSAISFIYYKVDFELGGVDSMLQIGWFSQGMNEGPVVIVVMTRRVI